MCAGTSTLRNPATKYPMTSSFRSMEMSEMVYVADSAQPAL